MRIWILGFITFSIAVTGCSGGSSKSATYQAPSRKAAIRILESDQVVCEGQCPETVGAFYLYSTQQVGNLIKHNINVCSATLIDSDKIITNRHCIEDYLKEGDLCEGSIEVKIKFPKTSERAIETVNCRRVLKTSDVYYSTSSKGEKVRRGLVPDWAVIELDRKITSRSPARLQSLAEADGTEVQLFPVTFNFNTEPVSGVVKAVQCRQKFNESSALFALDSLSALFKIERCTQEIVRGNSGSGVFLKSSGDMVGLVAFGSRNSKGGLGTAAHCLPSFQGNLRQECYFSADREFSEAHKVITYFEMIAPNLRQIQSKMKYSEHPAWKWSQNPFSLSDLRDLRISLRGAWLDLDKNLEANNLQRLRTKYLWSLLRPVLPRLPVCVRAGAAGLPSQIPIGDIVNWSPILASEWQESVRDKGEVALSWSPKQVVLTDSVATVQVVTTAGTAAIMLTQFSASSPFEKVQMKIPICAN